MVVVVVLVVVVVVVVVLVAVRVLVRALVPVMAASLFHHAAVQVHAVQVNRLVRCHMQLL